jgi:hypothetical protein
VVCVRNDGTIRKIAGPAGLAFAHSGSTDVSRRHFYWLRSLPFILLSIAFLRSSNLIWKVQRGS